MKSPRKKTPKPGLLIFERDEFICAYCIRVFDHCDLHMDHIRSSVNHGPDVAGNLITACRKCNSDKSGCMLSDEEEDLLLELVFQRNQASGIHQMSFVGINRIWFHPSSEPSQRLEMPPRPRDMTDKEHRAMVESIRLINEDDE
jgi:hypothetical protein